jgi:gliding motility-associated-like protein
LFNFKKQKFNDKFWLNFCIFRSIKIDFVMKKTTFLLVITSLFVNFLTAQKLIDNGDFESTITKSNSQIWITDSQISGGGLETDRTKIGLSRNFPLLPLSVTYFSVNPTCNGANNGTITIYPSGGTPPYTSYSISGTSSQTNTTGIFINLLPGTYTISVTDSSPSATSLSGIVIVEPSNPLIVSSNATICEGIPSTLSVSGSTSYNWTASPSDVTLTTPTSASPTVSPIVTTTYTVASAVSTPKNLVFNGDFSQGNVGFTTDYQYLASAPIPNGLQKGYGIVTNPSSWFSPFSICGDHPSGMGNMMVMDGSTSNAGNDLIWSQTIPVIAGQNYTFTYWIQSVTNTNPATINAKINGVSLGIGTAPNTIVCGNWVQFTYTWNSGTYTTAVISLYDSNVSQLGNDFALDDISFTTSSTCNYSKSVNITVNPKPTVTILNNFKGCSSQLTANPGTLGFGNYSYDWTVPALAANPGNVFSFLATVSGTYTVKITNTATDCVSDVVSINLVFPVLSVNPISNIRVCNGDLIPSVVFTSNFVDPNIIYTWTCDNPLLGIGSAGSSTFPTISAINNTSSLLVATITVTATLLGCQNSLPVTFSIKIDPKPKVVVNNIIKCIGDTNAPVVTATPAVTGNYTYTWTVPTGIANPGNVASFSPVDPILLTCTGAFVRNYSVIITDNITNCISDSAVGTISYSMCTPQVGVNACLNSQVKVNPPESLCSNSSCTILTASYEDERATTSYTVKCIPYAPLVPTGSPLSQVLCTTDDRFSDVATLPFNFSFFGNCYTQFQVSTNTFLTFNIDPTKLCATGVGSNWAFTQSIPSFNSFDSNNPQWKNAIYFPMQDTNPGVVASPPVSIVFTVFGVFPCRKAVIDVKNMPLFFCNTNQGLQESQLVLYEGTNIIDIYVKKRSTCASWNSGSGVLGIQNATGTQAVVPPGRNTGTWTTTNEAWRFTPNGASLSTFKWFDDSGTVIGTTPTVSVCPSVVLPNDHKTYTAQVKYNECGVTRTVSQSVDVYVYPDDTQTPQDIINCDPNHIFDLTTNEPIVLGSVPAGNYVISYYTSQFNAENDIASIGNPTAYISNGETIYMALVSTNNICVRVKAFNLIVKKWNLDLVSSTASTNQTVCANNVIDNITYQFGGEYTGAVVTGLPPGVSYSVIGNSVFIYGVPTVPSATPYTFSITSTGSNCLPTTLTGSIYVPLLIPPVITCGTPSLTSVQFNWSSLAGATDYLVSYQVNSNSPVNVGSIGSTPTSFTVNNLISGDSVTLTLTPKGNTTTCFTSASLTCVASPCPTITNPIGDQTLCIGGNPSAFSVNTTFTGANSISYVYFTSAQTGSAIYSGGMPLGTATPNASGVASFDAPILGNPGSLPNTASTYYVYAIANPAPTDFTCRPYQLIQVVVNSILTPSISCGTPSTNSVTFNWSFVSGATSYTATYTVNSGTPTVVTNIGNVNTYLVSGLNPNDSVCITITPVGAAGTCFASSTKCCTASPCAQPTVTVTSQAICQGASATITASPLPATGTYSYAWTTPLAVNPSTSTSSFSTSVAGTYSVVVTDTATGCVSSSASGTVTVNPLPTVTVNSPSVCQGQLATVTAVPLPATGTYSYAWTTSFIPNPTTASFTTSVTGTHSVVVTDTSTGCVSSSATGTVSILTAPTVNTPSNYEVCDDNNDGVSCLFFLHTKDSEITSNPTLNITYHLTLTDSQTGNNPILLNSPYCNINNAFTQILYIRVIDPLAPACYSNTTLQLIVNPKPVPKPVIANYELCDVNNSPDAIEVFNLPTKDIEIINGQTSMVVTYYLTQLDAINQTSPIPNPTSYSSTTRTIWFNLKNTITGCNSVGSFNLVVNPLPIVTVNSPTACQGDGATLAATVSVGGIYSYVWSVPAGVNPGNVQSFTALFPGTYTVVVTNTATGCVSAAASGTVSHISAPIITQPSDYIVCDDNNDGVSCLFFLHTKDSEITSNPALHVSYHLTDTDAHTDSNAITQNPYCNINSAFTQTLYVRVFDPLAPTCSSYTTLKLIVNPKPVANQPTPYHLCDTNASATISEATFDLTTVVTPQVLGPTPPATNAVTYYETLANAQVPTSPIATPSAYLSGTKTIWIRVQNTQTGCYDIISVNLVVDPLPVALAFYPQFEKCEDALPLGIETFDLTTQVTSILNGQNGIRVDFYPSLADATNNPPTNVITPASAYTNTQGYAQTLGIRLTNTTTGCYVISTMDLVVNPKPQPRPQTHPYVVCDDNQDGVTTFDLNTLTPDILLGAPAVYTISYYLTQSDAQTPQNPIDLTVPFLNNNFPNIQFLWVRAEDPITHCFKVIQIELNVSPAPVAPTNLLPITICDTDNNPNGCTNIDLTQQTNAILLAQPPGSSYNVTYYTDNPTPPNVTAPIINTSSYYSCGTGTIWFRVQNNAAPGCFSVGSFQTQVNTPLALTTPTLLSVCDNDSSPNDLHTTFDMVSFVSSSLPSSGYTLQFFLDSNHNNLIIDPAHFVNTINAVQTVFLVVTNNATGCKSYRTLTVQVLPIPTPRTDLSNLPLVSCDINNPNDGYEVFDLTTNALYIMNNDANVSLHYYPTKSDAQNNTHEIILGSPIGIPTAANVNQNVWIRVESNYFIDFNNEHCYVLVEQPIKVNPLPLIKPNFVYQECDDDTDGLTAFHLNTQLTNMLQSNPAIDVANCTFDFYEDAGLSIAINPTTYTNLSNPQTIYVVVRYTPTGCKSPATPITLEVNPKPLITPPINFVTCDTDGTNDGYFAYPLDNALITSIIGTQPVTVPPATYSVTFYNSQADAASATAPINSGSAYMTYSHLIWIRIENDLTHCYRTGFFETIVEQQAQPEIFTDNDIHVLCVSYNSANHAQDQIQRPLHLQVKNNTIPYLDIDGNPATYPVPIYTYQWYVDGVLIVGATNDYYDVPIITTGAVRQFTVEMISANKCLPVKSANFQVLQSGQAVPLPTGSQGYTVTHAFSENQTITVNVEGYGTYQYSLDDGPRQTSNVFENVSLGDHSITIWDTEGGIASSCDPLVLTEVRTTDYPHYFTPNGDDINDNWNIVGLQYDNTAKIYIFDRYGKLIKQISPQSKGWDGTYNGNLMPSTDYWFTVDYSEDKAYKQFKAHFSLKR